jgi:thiamine biosynthesis lipoprotein
MNTNSFVITQRTDVGMNTLMSIEAEMPKDTAEKAMEGAFLILSELNETFSRYRISSDVSRINVASGNEHIRVGRDTWLILESSIVFASLTDGYFDPTVGPLTDLWRISVSGDWTRPTEEQISAARELVGYREISLVSPDMARLNLEGATLDLGAVAKGYAADRVAKYLKDNGARSAMLDFGGEIMLLGTRRTAFKAVPWRVGVRHPSPRVAGRVNIVCSLSLALSPEETLSFATSGSYERFREYKGRKLSHVFDPHTGLPVDTNLVSVSVIDPLSARADALATAFLVMGENRAREMLSRFPGTEAVFVHLEGNKAKVSATEGLRGKIRLVDEAASLEINQ